MPRCTGGGAYRLHAVRVPQRWPVGAVSEHPRLGYDITWLSAHEEGHVDDHLLTAGRRNATERVALLLMHLYRRMERIGLVEGGSVAFLLNQQHIADALGLSLVHTNKTLRRLSALVCTNSRTGGCACSTPGRWRALPSITTGHPGCCPCCKRGAKTPPHDAKCLWRPLQKRRQLLFT